MPEPRYLLDTNICIYLLDGRSPEALARVEACETGTVVTSAIAQAEVLSGLARLGIEGKGAAFFEAIPALPFDGQAARAYAALPFKRADYDRLIAAHARAANLILVTNDPAGFAWSKGLRVENWTLPFQGPDPSA